MARLVQLQPIDYGVTRGPRATFGETAGAAFRREQEVGELTSRLRFEREIYQPLLDQMDVHLSGPGPARVAIQGQALSLEMAGRLTAQEFAPDDDLLNDLFEELETRGIALPDDVTPETIIERRERLTQELLGRVEREDEILSRGRGFSGLAGQLVGGFGAGFDNIESIVTLPFGAASRAGILATALIEGGINAATEAATTPTRNRFLRDLGLPEESILENAAFGFAVGGTLGGGLRSITRLGEVVRDRRASLIDVAEASGDAELEALAGAVRRDLEDEEAGASDGDPTGLREHQERAQAAAQAAQEGGVPDMPDRPTFASPRASILNGEIEEVDPRDLLVQPDVFQFRSNVVAEGGQTQRLLDVTEWYAERAGIVIVYEYGDGSRAIADGHQRTGLARRIMEQTGQDITMAARVFREIDGFSTEDIRVLAALKNIAEASDGMSTAMARDAARVLRVRPDAIAQLPAGPGIARAQSLARLSDEAFDMFINQVVPERFAELVGRMVENPEMHAAMMQLLRRAGPDTTAQAESILDQALQAPVSREITSDLFGDQEVVESLYLERAKVLERAMRIMRDDRSVFRTLDERADRIQGTGANRLDTATNKQTRQNVEQALAAVQRLAHRAGPISEALNDGAKGYKENGRLKDAAQRVADAVRQEVERNGLSGAGAGASGRGAEPARASAASPDPVLEGFSDPVNGEGVRAQIANTKIEPTRLDANERPADSTTTDDGGLVELQKLVSGGADRALIDNHPVLLQALDELDERASRATNLSENYGSEDWHRSRTYRFEDSEVLGTETALPLWVEEAEAFAGGQPKRERMATIVLGPPAAGKSTIANELARVKGAAILDSDEIKKTLPEFEGGIGAARVHEESSDLADLLEAALRADGTNVVFPKVGSSPGSIRRAVERFKADGYTVEIVSMAVTSDNAYRRMIGRFVKTGRIIPPSYVDAVGETPSATYRTLKEEGAADGYAEIDNNGGLKDPKKITDREGRNPFVGSIYDLPEGRREGDVSGKLGAAPDRGGVSPQIERTSAGDQSLFDGIEPITQRTRLDQRASQPLGRGGGAADDTEIGGLFDPNDPARFDLFDAVPVARGFDDEGNEIAVVKSRADLAAELDADDEAVAVLDLCVKG